MSVENQQQAVQAWLTGPQMKKMYIFWTASYSAVLLSDLMFNTGFLLSLVSFAITLIGSFFMWKINKGDIKALRTYSTLLKVVQVLIGVIVALMIIVTAAYYYNYPDAPFGDLLPSLDVQSKFLFEELANSGYLPSSFLLTFGLYAVVCLLKWRYAYLQYKVFRTLSNMAGTETLPRKMPFGRMRVYECFLFSYSAPMLIINIWSVFVLIPRFNQTMDKVTSALLHRLPFFISSVCMILFHWFFASLLKDVKNGCKTLAVQESK